jgi:hypothetical protein
MSVNNPSLVEVRDEGVSQGRVITLNFTGAGVTASVTGLTGTVNIPGGGGGSVSATRVVVALPPDAQRSYTVTVVDAAVLATSKVLVWLSGLADSNPNSNMEDSLVLKAFAGTGLFILQLEANQPMVGNISIDYVVFS